MLANENSSLALPSYMLVKKCSCRCMSLIIYHVLPIRPVCACAKKPKKGSSNSATALGALAGTTRCASGPGCAATTGDPAGTRDATAGAAGPCTHPVTPKQIEITAAKHLNNVLSGLCLLDMLERPMVFDRCCVECSKTRWSLIGSGWSRSQYAKTHSKSMFFGIVITQ